MPDRIERQPPGIAGRGVAQRQGGKAVRRLVQGDRQDDRDDGQGEIEQIADSRQQPRAFVGQRRGRQRQPAGRQPVPGRAQPSLRAGRERPGRLRSSASLAAKSPLQYSAMSQPAASARGRQIGRGAGESLHRQIVGHQHSFEADPATNDVC